MFKNYKGLVIITLLACILTIAVGYSILSQRLDISGTSNITTNFSVKITNITSVATGKASDKVPPVFDDTTATFNANFVSPGDKITYDITVSNLGNIDAVLEKINMTTSNNSAILFSYSGIAEGETLKAGDTTILQVVVEYLSSVTSQPESITSDLILTLDYSDSLGNLPEDYVYPTLTIDELIATAVTNGDGLYADTYEAGRYIYRGAEVNNYVTFNNEEAGWRIIGVEADGSLKLIRASSLSNMTYDTPSLRGSASNGAGGTYCVSSTTGCNAWAANTNLVGSPTTFVNGSVSGTVLLNAKLNTYLNTEYINTLSTEAKQQIIPHNFSVGPVTWDNNNLANQIISENSYLWYGNIGLMSSSDYFKANTNTIQCSTYSLNLINYVTCKSTVWLQDIINTSANGAMWIINPLTNDNHSVIDVTNESFVGYTNANNVNRGVAPVIYLSSDVTLTGYGTIDVPYIIK